MYELFLRYEFSKITHRIEKNYFNHCGTYAVKWQFLAEIPSGAYKGRFDTQEQSMLLDST
jgi:hypothetical protein